MKFVCFFINICLIYQTYAISDTNFTIAWNNFLKDPQLSHAICAITILDNSTGAIEFSFNKDVGLATASTLKTLTGTAALHYLGTDYQYKTLLQYSGTISPAGVLDGYIYIVGSGDPCLGSWRWNETKGDVIMNQWLSLIRRAGIKECQGIVLDLSAWPGQTQTVPGGYPWGDMGHYYGTGTSALNWRENQFLVYISPGKTVNAPAKIVSMDLPPPSVTFINEITTGPAGTGQDIDLFLAPDGTTGYFRGTISIDSAENYTLGCSIPNASLYIADELRRGMGWPNSIPIKVLFEKEANATHRETLNTYVSPPLSEILYWFLQISINHYGELLIKTISNTIGTPLNSVLQNYCEQEHGIEPTAVDTMDGSGLSPETRITTSTIAHVLYDVRKKEAWFPVFEKALPIINDIRMKSGTIHNVLAYAGYVNSKVFSFIINNYNGDTQMMREKMWKLLDNLK